MITFIKRSLESELESRVSEAADYAIKKIGEKIDQKRISNTGALKKSLRKEITKVDTIVQAVVYMKAYGEIHSKGVPPERIPFTPGRRGGGKRRSAYIQGLYTYFRSKGKSDKDAKSAAFATATLQKKYGAPLGYYRRTKKGSQFLEETIREIKPQLDDILRGSTGSSSTKMSIADIVRSEIRLFIQDEFESIGPIQIMV